MQAASRAASHDTALAFLEGVARRRRKGGDAIAREDIRAETPVFAGYAVNALTLRGLMP
jgi:hypothetical protein